MSRNRGGVKFRPADAVPLKRSLDSRTISQLELDGLGRCRRQELDRQLFVSGIVEHRTAADVLQIELSAGGELASVSGTDSGHAPIMQMIPNVLIAAVSLFFIASGTVGYLFKRVNIAGRIICYVLAALMLVPFLVVNYIGLGLGVVVMVLSRTGLLKIIETKENEITSNNTENEEITNE